MDIKEVSEEKNKTEMAILQLLVDFTQKTGLSISEVSIKQFNTDMGHLPYLIKCEVKL